MEYTCTLEINKPKDIVVEKYQDENGYPKWMEGYQGHEILEGEKGQTGCVTTMSFFHKKRKLSMEERVLENALPDKYILQYNMKGTVNQVSMTFDEIDENTTKLTSHQKFEFGSLGMKFMCWIMPGAFKKQTLKYLTAFRKFCEK